MASDITLPELLERWAAEPALAAADFRGYKLSTLDRRLQHRRQQLQLDSRREYLDYARAHPAEAFEFRRLVRIPVTSFFRDRAAWEYLRNAVLPGVVSRVEAGDALRVWCAGCSTGEEVYSIAILIAEALGKRRADAEVNIYATDVDESALEIARRGRYEPKRLRSIPKSWRARYFEGPGRGQVKRELRQWAIFGKGDLRRDPPIAHVRLTVCRNVLIYFDAATQAEILARLHFGLTPGGVLFLGRSESLAGHASAFQRVHVRWRIFRAKGERAALPAATEPCSDQAPVPVADAVEQELQFANEELQSANEELETMNEQLQSTNEDLVTSNEALQALNHALEGTSAELVARQQELDRARRQFEETLDRLPWPVLLVDEQVMVRYCNRRARRLFGIPSALGEGLPLPRLPLDEATQRLLLRQHRQVLRRGQPALLRRSEYAIHVVPVDSHQIGSRRTLVIFEPKRDTGKPPRPLGAAR